MFRIAVDIGGTFTDAVVIDEQGRFNISKVPSTPSDYSDGMLHAVEKVQVPLDEVEFFAHGTTTCVNALVQGLLAPTGLLTTKGFGDVLQIGRGNRVEIYDQFYKHPPSLVPKRLRLEVPERTLYDGSILSPLDRTQASTAVRILKKAAVQAIAICLIHGYANPQHERELLDIVAHEFPEAYVCASHQITREYYEYERTCTTVINAGLIPLMSRYLTSLEDKLRKRKLRRELYIMQANGGLMTSSVAKKNPVMTVNSGLVGGIVAVRTLSQLLGCSDVIGADMGGTSFDVELILSSEFLLRPMMRIQTPKSGPDGYPIQVPTIDIHFIGAGGGSVAWIDEAGGLHVGPKSMGADPGPACYGKGGDEPTVTDANVVLGRINPEYFLGGEMKIYPEFSRKAVGRIANYYGMDLAEAAAGIIRIVVANMAGAIHTMTTKRGTDPRELTMISFGGAGPLHTNLIQRELQIPTNLVTTMPGNTSAWGMLMADVKHDYVQSHVELVDKADFDKLETFYQETEEQARKILAQESVSNERMQFLRSIDIRYVGQGHALTIPLSQKAITEAEKTSVAAQFDEQHLRTYLNNAPKEPKEIVALRLTALGLLEKASLPEIKKGSEQPEPSARKALREVFFEKEFLRCPIYDRVKLLAGNIIEGPAVIEQTTSTILVLPDYKVKVDRYGHCVIHQ